MIYVHDPTEGWEPPSTEAAGQAAREATEASLEHLAGKVAEDAAVTPGWEDFAEGVGVHAHDGEQYVGLHPDHPDHEKYFDLEYGTQEQAPTGFLRNALTRHERSAGDVYSSELTHRALGGWRQ